MRDLFVAELVRAVRLFFRYPVDSFGGLLLTTISFFMLLAGSSYLAGPVQQYGDRLDALIVSYWLWAISQYAVMVTASELQSEAQVGTLEQLYLSPHGPLRVLIARAAASLALNLGTSTAILALLLLLTGRRLAVPAAVLVPLLAVVLGAYGLGTTLGGLTLVYKRVRPVLSVVQWVLLVLVMTQIEALRGSWLGAATYALPVAPGAMLLRDLMVRQVALDVGGAVLATGAGVVHFALGAAAFALADRAARVRGLIGQH